MIEGPSGTIGRYQVLATLGRGGMGEVYLAEDPNLHRRVALKVLPLDLVDDPQRRAWFRREAASAAALNHPNICTIFEIAEADGRLFIAMEAIEGRTLSARIAGAPIPLEEALDIALQVADALDEAQRCHIVHRDLKSSNIMLTPKGQVKILDFGLAKRLETAPSPIATMTTMVTQRAAGFGTLAYMSPEQMLGRLVDHRSDLFSFGVVIYHMLAGHLPFQRDTSSESLDLILHHDPPSLSTVNRHVPATLAAVVARLVHKDPARRYQSARELSADLRAIKAGRRAHSALGRRLRRLAAAAIVIAVALGGIGWWSTRGLRLAPDSRAIVVVPATVEGGPEFLYLTEAIAASITTRLSERGGVRVKVPPTVAEFERIGRDLTRVGESYGVRACLVPRVMVAGNQISVVAQIVDPKSREILWTSEYQGSLAGYVTLTDRVAQGVSAALGASSAVPARVPTSTASSSVELALRRGDYHANQFNLRYRPEDFDEAQRAFQDALATDPKAGDAASGLAMLYLYRLQGGLAPELGLPMVESWARQALQLSPRYELAWTALAHGDLWRSQPDLTKQLEYGFQASLGENCARCQAGLIPGMFQVSLLMIDGISVRQAEIDPLYAYSRLNDALALGALGRTADATRSLAKGLALEPGAPWSVAHEGFVRAQAGSMRDAVASFKTLKAREGAEKLPGWALNLIAYVETKAGDDAEEATVQLNRMRESIRTKKATAIEVQYLTDVAVPMLAVLRDPAATALLEELARAGFPAPLDMLRLNPALKRVLAESDGRAILAASLDRFGYLRRAMDAARKAGRFPAYLESSVRELRAALPEAGL
jgi:TolB-like protein